MLHLEFEPCPHNKKLQTLTAWDACLMVNCSFDPQALGTNLCRTALCLDLKLAKRFNAMVAKSTIAQQLVGRHVRLRVEVSTQDEGAV